MFSAKERSYLVTSINSGIAIISVMQFTKINTFPNHNPSGEKVQLNPCLYDRCILAMQFSRLIRNHTALHYFDAD